MANQSHHCTAYDISSHYLSIIAAEDFIYHIAGIDSVGICQTPPGIKLCEHAPRLRRRVVAPSLLVTIALGRIHVARTNCTRIFRSIAQVPPSYDQVCLRSQDHVDNLQAMQSIKSPSNLPLGSPLPPNDVHVRPPRAQHRMKHAVSINTNLHSKGVGVHLPEWRDTVGWAARERRVVDAMRTGYPRFFVPRVVDELAGRIIELYRSMANGTSGVPDGKASAIVFPTRRYAEIYLQFLARQASPEEVRGVQSIALKWEGSILPLNTQDSGDVLLPPSRDHPDVSPYRKEISAVLYPSTLYPLAKAFWQHTGFGISSRQATYWLENSPLCGNSDTKLTKNRCATKIEPDPGTAKDIIRGRIADGQSLSDLKVDKNNMLLYPTGMTAITETASAIKRLYSAKNRTPTAAVFG